MPVFEQYVRPTNPTELRLMNVALERERKFQQRILKMPLRMFLMSVAFFLPACLLATVFDHYPAWYYSVLIAFGVSGLIWTFAYPGMRRDRKKRDVRIRDYEAAIERNEVHVAHIHSDAMVEFDEEEDEGACYAFQVNDRRIVFVAGQDYYLSAKFPNSDFSLVEIRAANGSPLEGWIEKHGQKLKPLRTIAGRAKRHLMIPGHLEVIEGDLGQLEEILKYPEA